MPIRFGCHGSTWELNYDIESDNLLQITDVVKEAGFKGIDVQISLLGKFKEAPEKLKMMLEEKSLNLAALTIPFSWLGSEETQEERNLADFYIDYVKHFPNAILNIAPRPGEDRTNLYERQQNIIKCANTLGRRAYEQGVLCSFHPSSPEGSVFRLEEDYKVLFEGLNMDYLSYTPDTGHIAFGGMNVYKTIEKYMPYIKHVHIKDATNDKVWKKMGTGNIDFQSIVSLLVENNYKGWIMVEEETSESSSNPDYAVIDIGKYVLNKLEPIAKEG